MTHSEKQFFNALAQAAEWRLGELTAQGCVNIAWALSAATCTGADTFVMSSYMSEKQLCCQ